MLEATALAVLTGVNMGQPRFEVPSGAINGSNVVFTVSLPYVLGSTAVWLNGVLLRRDLDDGWSESSPGIGEITLNEAPLASGSCPDVLQVFYKDSLVDPPDAVIEQIFGTISGEEGLSGVLSQEGDFLACSVASESAVSGFLADATLTLVGILEAEEGLSGVLTEDC